MKIAFYSYNYFQAFVMVYIIITQIILFAGIGHHIGHWIIIDLLYTVKKRN